MATTDDCWDGWPVPWVAPADTMEAVESALTNAERSVAFLQPSPQERRLKAELEICRRMTGSWRTVAPTAKQLLALHQVLAEVLEETLAL